MYRKSRYHHLISAIDRNIKYYKEMIAWSSNPYERVFYERLLYTDRMRMNYWKNYYYRQLNNKKSHLDAITRPGHSAESRVFTLEELAEFDGSNGKPAYVAVNGIVYDVTSEATWGGGTHFSLYAGQDLTVQFTECHGARLEVLRNLPEVGLLKG